MSGLTQEVRNMTAAERAATGAQMLDEKHPGWYKQINLDTLDISEGCQCICGQLGALEGLCWADKASQLAFGHNRDYDAWESEQDAWLNFVYAHGFANRSGITHEWKKVIQARLDADKLTAPVEVPEQEAVCAHT